MDFAFLSDYLVPVIVGICLCIGYILKHTFPRFDNRYIPAVVGLLGLGVSGWVNWPQISPEVVLTGLVSGLASTGLHEVVHQLAEKKQA